MNLFGYANCHRLTPVPYVEEKVSTRKTLKHVENNKNYKIAFEIFDLILLVVVVVVVLILN